MQNDQMKETKGVKFENFLPFPDCISQRNNSQTGHEKDLDVLMWMYDLIEYSNNYFKTLGSLQQYYRDVSNDILTNSESSEFKVKLTGKTPATGNTRDAKIAVPLKYLSNF